ncbi:MAG: energy-coupling factor transporter transmembrane component T [Clostridiales bacterium]
MIKDNFLIGQYYFGRSWLHSLDARSKILATVFYMIALFTGEGYWEYALMGLIFLAGIFLSHVPWRMIWKGLRIVTFFVAITVLLNILIYPGEAIWSWGFINISQEGIIQGLKMGYRLLLLVAFGSLLTLTTKPMDLTDGLERLMKPLEKIKLPVHEISMIMSIALRFIPTILDELDRIMLAQRARGGDFVSKNIKSRIQQLLPLMIPLFVSAFRRADELAQAMEAKCYHGGEGRSHWRLQSWQKGDTI